MSQATSINLKEKTTDELKVFAWDLRVTLDTYEQAYKTVLAELSSRQQAAPLPEQKATEPAVTDAVIV